MTKPTIGKLYVTCFGPWHNAVVPRFDTDASFEIQQRPIPRTQAENNVTYARDFSHTGARQELLYDVNGSGYGGDAVKFSLTASAVPRIDAPEKFTSGIDNRVRGPGPSETVDTWDVAGTTWGDTSDSVKSKIEQYLKDAEKGPALTPFILNEIDRTNPDGIVLEKFKNKTVKYHESVFSDMALVMKLDEAARALREGVLEGRPKVTGEKWPDSDDFWIANLEFKWAKTPATRITKEVSMYLVEDVGYVTVYGEQHVTRVTEQYISARDAHNLKLEDAMFTASKGQGLPPAVRNELLTRPAASKDPVVIDEGNEWWGKFSTAVAQLDRVQVPEHVTDSNLKEKFPNGAGGMNSDELGKYVQDQRANGNTDPTSKVIEDIAYPKPHEQRKDDKPWWDRTLDSLDGLGSGVKDVLKDWGPMGTVGAYGGIKAVNKADKNPWLWLALGGLALVLIAKD